jgi:serine/threonine-protein kinase
MPRRPRSRWVDIASHAMAVVLIACAGLVIAHRLGVPLPGLHRAGVAPVVPPAASALPDASVAAVDPAPAAAPDPPPVAVDLPAAAPAGAESPSPNSRRPPPRPSVAQVAPLAAAADAGAAAQATGTVLLAISPWGEVLVDGVGRGVTPPLDRIALAPGSYRFEVRNPAAPRYAATLEVRAGESITLKHRF